MEKKIEITEAEHNIVWWYCEIIVDGVHEFKCFGNTKEQAEQNARIATSGYLVEELVPYLEHHLNILKFYHKSDSDDVIKLTELLTKAKM